MSPLHLAAWSGKVEVARLLVETGAEVDTCSNDGETPLILASQHGNSDVVGWKDGTKLNCRYLQVKNGLPLEGRFLHNSFVQCIRAQLKTLVKICFKMFLSLKYFWLRYLTIICKLHLNNTCKCLQIAKVNYKCLWKKWAQLVVLILLFSKSSCKSKIWEFWTIFRNIICKISHWSDLHS